MGIKQWILPSNNRDEISDLRAQTGYPEVLCAVLYNRGYRTKDMVDAAFGQAGALDDPYTIKDMDKAVTRVRQALEDGERIAVYGDYDCDGITSTALLVSYLQSVGADVIYYIPSREKEGYGLNVTAVNVLHDQKVNLIITVDNGISAHGEIAHAAALGMDVVVTDHHTPRDMLPEAVAVVNPHRTDCPSRFKELAGVGVAFKLICSLEEEGGEELLEYYSDLVMLGTVADVVAITGENRSIVTHGLARILDTERPGLQALMELSGMKNKAVSSESVAFGIIPRLNAAGRMGCADDAVELLLTDDVSYAKEMAEEMNLQNERRKETEAVIMAEIEGMLAENPQILTKRVLTVTGDGWCHGVVGIVAAKIVEKYDKPAILFSVENGVARGSGRSVEGFSLVEAITACSQHLTQFGGHTLAAGLTLPSDKLEAFDAALQAYALEHFPVMPVPPIPVDCALTAGQLTSQVVAELNVLEPFGAQNWQPLFLLEGMLIQGVYPTADKKHIRIRFGGSGDSFYAVFFRMSEDQFPYKVGDTVDAIVNLSLNEYNGKVQVSVKIKDLRLHGIPQEDILAQRERYSRHLLGLYGDSDREALLPSREDFAVVYRFLRGNGGFAYGNIELYYRIWKTGMGFGKMQVALDVLEELGLITRDGQGEDTSLHIIQNAAKVDMDASTILGSLKM